MPNAREEFDRWKSLLGHSTGGIDLGLERAGMVTRWFCEIDPHCRNVLARHWPGLPVYGDITAIDWSGVEPVDVLAGGFPCQPVSAAGLRRGTSDGRWLWPAFADAIRALRPRYVLVENVPGLLRPWLDRNGCGLWHEAPIEEVIADLATLGYRWEYDSVPASAVGAPHIRDRVWIVAYAQCGDAQLRRGPSVMVGEVGAPAREAQQWQRCRDAAGGRSKAVADADRERGLLPTRRHVTAEQESGSDSASGRLAGRHWWAVEPDVDRVVDGLPHRVDRLRALGNAVVPQVVEPIGRSIVAFDEGRVAA